MRGEQPLVQRDVRTLHHRAGSDGELVAAIVAEEHASLGLAAHAADVGRATMRAVRLFIRPARQEDVALGGFLVVEDRIGDVDVHGGLPC